MVFETEHGAVVAHICIEPLRSSCRHTCLHGIELEKISGNLYFHALEKEMATHSSVLAWRLPGTGEPGGLPSMGSHRVGHD